MCKSSLLWRLAGLVVLLSLLVTSATSAAPVKVAPPPRQSSVNRPGGSYVCR